VGPQRTQEGAGGGGVPAGERAGWFGLGFGGGGWGRCCGVLCIARSSSSTSLRAPQPIRPAPTQPTNQPTNQTPQLLSNPTPHATPKNTPTSQGLRATLTAFLSCAFYITLEKTWSFHIFTTHWYLTQPLFLRLCVMQVVGTVYRSRYYFAWSNGWASLAFAGFDFLKWDEKTGKAVWGRGCNSRPLKVGAARSFRGAGGWVAEEVRRADGVICDDSWTPLLPHTPSNPLPSRQRLPSLNPPPVRTPPRQVEFCDSGRKLAAHWNVSTGMFLRRWGGRSPPSPHFLLTRGLRCTALCNSSVTATINILPSNPTLSPTNRNPLTTPPHHQAASPPSSRWWPPRSSAGCGTGSTQVRRCAACAQRTRCRAVTKGALRSPHRCFYGRYLQQPKALPSHSSTPHHPRPQPQPLPPAQQATSSSSSAARSSLPTPRSPTTGSALPPGGCSP